MAVITEPPVIKLAAKDAEALIREARRLRRRRWAAGVALAIVMSVAVALPLGLTLGHRSRSPNAIGVRVSQRVAGVNIRAFSGQGELAFVSGPTLSILNGATSTVTQLPPAKAGNTISSPEFSPDGRWLAYLVTTPPVEGVPNSSRQTLLMRRSDGSDPHSLANVFAFYGWSPHSDLVAASLMSTVRYPYGATVSPESLAIMKPTGQTQLLMTVPAAQRAGSRIESATWSPNGGAVAVATTGPTRGSKIAAYPVNGGRPTMWFSINATSQLPGVCPECGGGGTIADLAGWWPRWGIGFWVYSSGAVHDLDATPLEVVAAPRSTPRLIGSTLSDRVTDAIASGPDGQLAIVFPAQGRTYGAGTEVETCELTARRCSALPGASVWSGPNPQQCSGEPCAKQPPPGAAGSGVSIDPAWSPASALLAYVKGPAALLPSDPSNAWFAAHELYLWNPRTGTSVKVGDVDGASVPTWSRTGREILYARDDGLWLSPASGARTVRIVQSLFPRASWEEQQVVGPSYYGQYPWSSQFSWWNVR